MGIWLQETVRKPCLAHFSTKWIRLAVKNALSREEGRFRRRGIRFAAKTGSRSVEEGGDPAGALGKAFNFIDFGESMSIVRHAL
jgi:hypothetical protein